MKGSDIRGQNHARADGQVVRPQLVMVDDPQTTESAWSPVAIASAGRRSWPATSWAWPGRARRSPG